MSILEILAIAIALSVDAFAVAVATGIKLGTVTWRQKFRLSFHFGLFQFLMPVLGWFLGLTVRGFIEQWDHWVAFILLSLIGLNMIRESRNNDEEEGAGQSADPTRGFSLFMLSVATSIDALAVGLSFALLAVPIWMPATIIGLTCTLITAAGMYLGRTLSRAEILEKRASLIGGLVLMGIGIRILYEHGVFSSLF